MSANVAEGAKRLGDKLLAEVEVEDLSSVLKSFRELQITGYGSNQPHESTSSNVFNIPELDLLFPYPTPPILELVSPPSAHHPSGTGKTSLLYLIIAYAILPSSLSSATPLGGQNASIILLDPLYHFSVHRLASVMLKVLVAHIRAIGKNMSKADMKGLISRSLLHVHIFQPQSWPSMLVTLRSLPDYLFDVTRHKSTQRRIHSIILEDIDAFVWSIRSNSTSTTSTGSNLATASTLLTTSLQRLVEQFSCGVILTSQSTSPTSFRPALPNSWPQNMPTTRLAVKRVDVLKFAPALCVEEAEVESAQRWEVVKRARFECWKVGIGVRDGEGFVFRVGEGGVCFEEKE